MAATLQAPLEALVAHFFSAFADLLDREFAAGGVAPEGQGAALERALDVASSRLEGDLETRLWHACQNLMMRDSFVRQSGGLAAQTEVAALLGTPGEQGLRVVEALEHEQRVFSLQVGGERGYPRFQFDPSGCPSEALHLVLTSLATDYGGWALASWWTASNAFLEGTTPIEVWRRDQARVVRAAAQEQAMFADLPERA
ncbi:hypothetical protein [Niveibacterium sp. SC-1]|uniref:hypothetical protein n=1 Tax=Niveibacterium sp. SC-1 TaxID=3135646 RepID=UPI00311E8919